MFDTLIILEGHNPVLSGDYIKCGHGHTQRSLQTKDFDCTLSQYFLFEDWLYYQSGEAESVREKPVVEDGKLVLRTVSSAALYHFTGTIAAYTSCQECLPVLTEGRTVFADFTTHQPWVDYEFTFKNGLLEKYHRVQAETRDDVRKKLAEDGLRPIPDEDRVAKKHFEKLKTRPGWGF